ncbi:hypothetical protein BKA93DRAFT_821181 [Sparassis latifolia]
MPARTLPYIVQTFHSARDLPVEVWDCFSKNPRPSNIMFPHAEKSRDKDRGGDSNVANDVYIVCMTQRPGEALLCMDLVLSCAQGPLGAYPVFIFTPIPYRQIQKDYIMPRLLGMVSALQESVPPERVFSVFAPEYIAESFASIWTQRTGIRLDVDCEYYAAKFTFCTRKSFRPRRATLLPNLSYQLRPAIEADIPNVVPLCYGFAVASEPFVLNLEGAEREAALLVRNGQLWVHEICAPGQPAEIASIVAVTRTSDTVAAITKVYTNPRWRQRGCAERLTRRVCEHFLKTKDSVVLYVAHNNPAAAKVYHRVGFVGLGPESEPAEGADSWLELGFDRNMVTLGHW